MMVHPVLTECVMVVRPSWVITEDPSIFSRQSSDFCCSWIHPKSFSPFGQGWLRIPSSSCIFVLETVILGGCLTIRGSGFGSQVVSSLDSELRFGTSTCGSWVSHSLSNSIALVSKLEHLQIETRLIDERFASVMGECVIESIGVSSIFKTIRSAAVLTRM